MARSVVTIDDLLDEEIEAVFQLADRFLGDMADPQREYRVTGKNTLGGNHILATVFYEPSTRTRLSFESAMLRMGGSCLSSADGKTTSAAKGETIADTVRVVENYADLIVIRHPLEGAARVAAEFTNVPVINAGDGGHEHPTQTLCDLYTLRAAQKQKHGKGGIESLRDLNVVVWGDLYHGRTVHSLAYALARFNARIIPLAAPGCEFPDHVKRRLARDYNCHPLSKSEIDEFPDDALPADMLYVTPDKPHQLALVPDVWFRLSDAQQKAIRGIRTVDAFYSTRLQLERFGGDEAIANYPIIDAKFLNAKKYKNTQILHPLPRVDELSYEIDRDPRGAYFKQASFGVPVRMALIAALLELQPGILQSSDFDALGKHQIYTYPAGINCHNPQCITNDKAEQRHLTCKFWIVEKEPLTIRCEYCDWEQRPAVVSRQTTQMYTTNTADYSRVEPNDLVLFRTERDAVEAGHTKGLQSPEDDTVAKRSAVQ